MELRGTRKPSRRRASRQPMALVAAAIVFWLVPAAALAQAQLREFTGQIADVDGSRIVVDNRMEDRVSFVRVDETVVQGQRSAWSELKRKDWVTISWKFVDKPKKAYVVRVLPPRRGED